MKRYYRLQPLSWQLSNNNQTGFSLVELLVVVAIIVFLATLVTVNTTFLHGLVIKTELQKLHTICHCLRRKAMMSNQEQQLVFDEAGYSYGETKEQLDNTIIFGTLPKVQGPPSAPHKIINEPITFKNKTIMFYKDGTVSSGTVYLTDMHNKYQYALSIPISYVPYIRIYAYDKNWNLVS